MGRVIYALSAVMSPDRLPASLPEGFHSCFAGPKLSMAAEAMDPVRGCETDGQTHRQTVASTWSEIQAQEGCQPLSWRYCPRQAKIGTSNRMQPPAS